MLITQSSKSPYQNPRFSLQRFCRSAAAVRAVGASASSLVAQALSCSSASSFPLSPSSLASSFEVGASRRRVAARRPCLRRRTEKENGNLNQQKDFRSVRPAHTRRNKKTNSFSALWTSWNSDYSVVYWVSFSISCKGNPSPSSPPPVLGRQRRRRPQVLSAAASSSSPCPEPSCSACPLHLHWLLGMEPSVLHLACLVSDAGMVELLLQFRGKIATAKLLILR
ncbi:uncharacterized protein DS421_2g59230 [Arachis hypogaea]|nr:uncharacterized protein DS421_2g59230 [Arachis hypogaea]